jgi:hypothetical protein
VAQDQSCLPREWTPREHERESFEDGATFVFSRSSCFGECPAFEARVTSDLRVEFAPLLYTRRHDPGERQLDPAQWERALQLATRLTELQSIEPGTIDASSTRLFVRVDDGPTLAYSHQYSLHCGGSPQRHQLEAELQQLLIDDWGDPDVAGWPGSPELQERRARGLEQERKRLLELERRALLDVE